MLKRFLIRDAINKLKSTPEINKRADQAYPKNFMITRIGKRDDPLTFERDRSVQIKVQAASSCHISTHLLASYV